MFKDWIVHPERSGIPRERGQHVLRRAAKPLRVGVIFGRHLLQQTKDFLLSQLALS